MLRFTVALAALLVLSACTEENVQPQPAQPEPVAAAPEPVVQKHNLSRVAGANAVTPEQLQALKVGVATKQEVVQLLGEIKPFTLGDGKQIYRYDVGKFIFDQHGVLIRKFLNP